MNGYTPETTNPQRVANLCDTLRETLPESAVTALVLAAVGESGGDCFLFERILAGDAQQVVSSDMEAAMRQRVTIIQDALAENPANYAALLEELAEIENWLARQDNFISDYADARLCARFGTGL